MIDVETLLEDLTEPQREAATHVDGPLLIVAGAGSGKTRVLTRRVGYLIAQGIPPNSILAVTFTNKAAGEMKSRVGALLGRPVRDFGRLEQPWPTICTFHSLCLRIIRHFGEQMGLPANVSIFDAADQLKLIKEALKALDISSTNFSPTSVHAAISNAKNQLLSAEAYAQAAGDFYQRTVARVFTRYQQLLAQNNALDFDDMLLRTAQAFRDHPDVLQRLQDHYRYLLIDEYQDTNHAQYVIAHAMAMKHRNLCVVGDPDQSIYKWRGADLRNILDFEQDYPDAKVVRLEQNYRSSKTILRVASELIAHNLRRKDKSLWTENPEGPLVKLLLCQDEHDEASTVMRELRELGEKGGVPWSRMAVFYRMNSLSRVIEKELFDNRIPYQIARGVEFYNRKEIKDLLAYLRVIANTDDEVSLTRIANVPTRGLGDAAIKQLQAFAAGHGVSLFTAFERAREVPGLSTRAANSAGQFVTLIRNWQALAGAAIGGGGNGKADETPGGMFEAAAAPADSRGRVTRLMDDVARRSGLESLYRKQGGDDVGEAATDNIAALITSAAEYDAGNPEASLQDYLAQVSLVSDADHMKGEGGGGAVTLMTLHAAKGLEFPVVAIIGMEEGVLPHSRSRGNLDELEEERRLCFVGITRAQERLILSRAAYRTVRGLRERTIASPFLAEMPRDALKVIDRTELSFEGGPAARREQRDRLRDESSQLAGQFRKGQLVRHPTFGIGRIAELSDMGQQTRAVVEFNAAGRKTLILQYARLEPVG